MKEHLRIIVNEPIAENEIVPFQMVKNVYKSCLNTALIDQRAMTPVLAVQDSMGGWPVVKGSSWIAETFTWQGSVANARRNGYSVSNFLSFSVSTDNKRTTIRIVRVIFSSYQKAIQWP